MSSTASLYTILNAVYDSTNKALRMVLNYVHTHATTAEGGQLDWDNIWSDAVHSHASDAEGGTLGVAATPDVVQNAMFTTQGDMAYAIAASSWTRLAKGTASQYLRMNSGATAPEWVTATPPIVTRKIADEQVINSTTLQNDDALFFAVAANEVWEFTLYMQYLSGATPDFKFCFTSPASSAIYYTSVHTDAASAIVCFVANASGATTTAIGTASEQIIIVHGLIVNAATAGNLQLQFAQNTQDAGSGAYVRANSCIIAHKIA